MTCEHCVGAEKLFDLKSAKKELRTYLKKGPKGSTKELVQALTTTDLKDKTLLDIGGGVGAIQFELESHGVGSILSVDASSGYQSVLKTEVEKRELDEKFKFFQGDFTDVESQIEPVDVVTLDKVTCCYPDLEKLLTSAISKTKSIIGLVHPKDSWWIKGFKMISTVGFWAMNNPFRFYPHPVTQIESILASHGFEKSFSDRGYFWITSVYRRV